MGLISRVSSRTYRFDNRRMSYSRSRSVSRSRSYKRSRSPRRSSRDRRRSSRSRSPREYKGNSFARKCKEESRVVGVFGMSSRTDERDLEQEFGEFGKIETVSIIYNRTTRESRGFGFITFEDKRDAVEAVDKMNGKRLDGREIRVDFSFTKDGRDGRRRDRSRERYGARDRSRSRGRDRGYSRRSRSRDRRRSYSR